MPTTESAHPLNLLAFDTSTDALSIAVQRGAAALGHEGAQVWHHSGLGGAQASATLIPAIRQLMQQAGLEFGQLSAIVFGRGPGSFTGLRTACSVAQGLAFGAGAAGVPVLPVDTLLAVAEEARWQYASQEELAGRTPPGKLHVTAMLDARMDEMYVQNYYFDSDSWASDGACSLIRPEALQTTADAMAGNVFAAYGQRLPSSNALPQLFALPTASALLRLAPALLQAGLAVPADEALPLYIRDKVAQTTHERLLAKSLAKALP
jgi:tRNA threonylcarbamoyladenosine biosynthesis protein TsaB